MDKSLISHALRAVLRPVVRFFVRHSCTFREFTELGRELYIRAAEEELRRTGSKINVSRLSAITGMRRDEINRYLNPHQDGVSHEAKPLGLISRVLGQWQSDPRFSKRGGQPRVLGTGTEELGFNDLVRAVSQHLNPGTVLFELLRRGIVDRTKDGVRLVLRTEKVTAEPEKGYQLLAADLGHLISAAEENLEQSNEIPNLHAHTEYDRVFVEALPEIRSWLLAEGRLFHKRAREFLSQFDADIHPDPSRLGAKTGRVVLTAYSWTSSGSNDNSTSSN